MADKNKPVEPGKADPDKGKPEPVVHPDSGGSGPPPPNPGDGKGGG